MQNNGILDTSGGFALTGNLVNNSGIVNSQNGTIDDVTTISGDFSGGGQLLLDVDLANDTADTLLIAGDVLAGGTQVSINNLSAANSATGNDIILGSVAGTTAAGDFVLAAPVINGLFICDTLSLISNNVVLQVGVPPAEIDHFEISYPDSALTCTPISVAVKACSNTDCSALYTPDVDVTLSPAVGWASNPVTISNGSVILDLSHTVAETVTVDVTASSIVPANPIQCIEGLNVDPACSINFADSGFVFDIPTLTACKTSAEVTIRAVKKSEVGVQCVGALTGTQTIDFWSTYLSPSTGTLPTSISGTTIATAFPGTPVDLSFDINGEATFTTSYDDAGQLQLNAKHITLAGLILEGDDTFVSKPVMLATFSDDANTACASGNASCSRFKKAGELFDLKVNAACWTDDADTDFTDNPVTPNFELTAITTDHDLVAPATGSAGTRSVSTFNFDLADHGSHTINQSVSEVGVFTFSVSSANYFGETLTFADSPNIGRFYPDHFETTTLADGNFSSACTGFGYSGQAFTYQTKPQLTATAYNAGSPAVITQNYSGDFAKLVATDFNVIAPTTDATQLGADATNLVRLNWLADAASLTDNNNGSHTLSFGNDSYTYLHQAHSQIAPFTNAVDLVFTAITDSDNVQTNTLPHTLQPAGEAIRFGRLNIANTHGSELVALPVAIKAEIFNGINWVDNTLDQCTTLNLATHLQLSNASTSGGSWIAGTSNMNIGIGTTAATLTNNSPLLSGQATLTLSAPGEDNLGYVDIRSQLSVADNWLLGDFDNDGFYDDNASARASFGLFKGSDMIIFRREVY